jgi:hypothetical protein
VLPDGDLLLAADSRGVVRLNASGVQTRVYPVPLLTALAIGLTDGGATALVGGATLTGNARLVRLDLDSGEITTAAELLTEDPRSVTPRYAWTAAIGESSHGGVDAPALSTWAILIVTAALALLALRRL